MTFARVSSHARIAAAALAAAAIALLLLATGARAATVVNGDFETGNFDGWTVVNEEEEMPGAGSWFVYSGEAVEIPEGSEVQVPSPPQGKFAAITYQGGPGRHILYQDVALEPGVAQMLKMTVYYEAGTELVTPAPETLATESGPNEQYRIDVMKPSAPLDSVASSDVLATVFATRTDGPESMSPRQVSVDLSPFAGQTVRLRLVEVDNEGPLFAGADAVSITPTGLLPLPPAPPAPSNAFTLGKLKLNRKNGTAKVPVTVPGPGTLTAVDARSGRKTVKKQTLVLRSSTATATAAGTTTLTLNPTGAAKKTLRAKGKLAIKSLVTFTPTGGTAATQTLKGALKLTVAKATAR